MSSIFFSSSFISQQVLFSTTFWQRKGLCLVHYLRNHLSLDSSLSLDEKKVTTIQSFFPFVRFWSCLTTKQKNVVQEYLRQKSPSELQTWMLSLLEEVKKTGIALDQQFLKELKLPKISQGDDSVVVRVQQAAQDAHIAGMQEEDRHPIASFYRAFVKSVIACINTICQSTNISQSALSAQTIWEKAYSLDIVFKLLMVPFALVHFFAPVGTSLIALLLITGAVLVGAGAFLYVYQTYLRPCPKDIPHCDNLRLLARRENTMDVGQKQTLAEILSYSNQKGTGYQQLLLVGRSGLGKTSAIYRATKHLTERQMFLINTPEFLEEVHNQTYASKWQQIRSEIKKHKNSFVFVFEEFGEITRKKQDNFAAFLKHELGLHEIRCIALVTEEEYQTFKDKHPDLLNRFRPFHVPEWTHEEVKQFLTSHWASHDQVIPLKDEEQFFAALQKKITVGKSVQLRYAKDLIDRIFDDYLQQWERKKQANLDLVYWFETWQTMQATMRKLACQLHASGVDDQGKQQFLFLEKVMLPGIAHRIEELMKSCSDHPPFTLSADDVLAFDNHS